MYSRIYKLLYILFFIVTVSIFIAVFMKGCYAKDTNFSIMSKCYDNPNHMCLNLYTDKAHNMHYENNKKQSLKECEINLDQFYPPEGLAVSLIEHPNIVNILISNMQSVYPNRLTHDEWYQFTFNLIKGSKLTQKQSMVLENFFQKPLSKYAKKFIVEEKKIFTLFI